LETKEAKHHDLTLASNRRPAIPLGASRQFERAAHAQACISGGGRSAFRHATFRRRLIK
jgi:hypothetical protein